jgi:hypothetical protein
MATHLRARGWRGDFLCVDASPTDEGPEADGHRGGHEEGVDDGPQRCCHPAAAYTVSGGASP